MSHTMFQTTITSYFNSKKRPPPDDIVSSKNKIRRVDCKNNESVCDDVKPTDVVKTELKLEETAEQCTVSTSRPDNVEAFRKKTWSNVPKAKEPSKSEVVNAARKELSLGEIRKKLAGSSRLADLKAYTDRVSKNLQQFKKANEKRNLQEFKSIDVEVPASPSKRALIQNTSPAKHESTPLLKERPLISPRKVAISPIKSPAKVPAYIRHAALASTISLPLPHHYRFLAELFRAMETIVSLLYNKDKKITFAILKPSVQEMLKRSFTEKHLAQVKHLVPDFYNFEVKKIKNFSTTSQKDAFELIISPNIHNNIKIMNPSVILERRRYFYDSLLQLVKKHHAQFLSKLEIPLVIPDDKVTRWHPEFELEKVPEIECAKLPEMPNVEKISSAQDVLAKARELFKCNTKMERALEKLAQAKTRGLTEQEKEVTGINDNKAPTTNNISTQTSAPTTSDVTILNPALRNLPASLLEKVKAKQAAKALEAMMRSSEYDKKYLIYSRLPDLARTLRNIYVTERKNVLALNIVLSKLDISFESNVSASDLQRDIKTLAEEVPKWITFHTIRNNTYLKLDKNADLQMVVNKLTALAEKYKSV